MPLLETAVHVPAKDAVLISAADYLMVRQIQSKLFVMNSAIRCQRAALEEVVKACDAECGLKHIKWLAKEGLK